MALDGALLHKLIREIEQNALGARVDKIHQPAREEVVLFLRSPGFSGRLLLSASGSAPRLHFTRFAPENPAVPPMFCMLLRKTLSGARLTAVRQYGLDRVAELEFETRNELGDTISPRLVVEIMGGRSNILLIGSDGRIVDAVRRSDPEKPSVRMIFPGAVYQPPERQDKVDLLKEGAAAVVRRVQRLEGIRLADALSRTVEGVSRIVCRETALRACRDADIPLSAMGDEQYSRLEIYLTRLAEEIDSAGRPVLVSSLSGEPLDFTFIEVSQYGGAAVTRSLPDYSTLLDSFYAERERVAAIKRKGAELLRLLSTTTARISRKLDAQRGDLARCADREKYRVFGELLKANLHSIPRGASAAVVQNYYDPDLGEVKIPLNAALSPAANAQKYFRDYKKSYTAEQTLTRLIAEGEEELRYLDSVFDALSRAETAADLAEIREELAAGGYLRLPGGKKNRQPAAGRPMEFCSSDGIRILVGRNNRQNDQLTLKTASRDDLWLHVKEMPGAHVVVCSAGAGVPDATLREAAILAAYFSKGRDSASVPVDCAPVRRVKKPAGARPGMVIYTGHRTLYTTPDREVCRRLAVPKETFI